MADSHAPRFLRLVDEARAKVRETDVETVRKRLEAGETVHLIDVREESEYARGRLPGARHLGKGIIERDIERVVPDPNTPLVLYCGGGFRSALAADNLRRMGYTRVESMDGGFRAWTEAGLPVEPPDADG
jgi:rhodanese-related sulfurtransferase